PFYNSSDTLSHADAHSRQAIPAPAPLQFVQQCHNQPGATAAKWMPQSNRAPVDVELLLVNLQLAYTLEYLDGKGFVEFNQVHIFDTQSGTLQNLASGRNRPQAHISRINARHCRGDDTSARAQAKF